MAISLKDLKPEVQDDPPRLIFYGKEAIGKSTLAAQMPSPIFIKTAAEHGRLAITSYPFDNERKIAETYADIESAICALIRDPHSFKTLVIDHLTGVEKLLHAAMCEEYNEPDILGRDKGSNFSFEKGYKLAAQRFTTLCEGLNVLNSKRGMLICLLAHVATPLHKSPDTDDFNYYDLAVESKFASPVFRQWADGVFFLTRKKPLLATEDQGFGKKKAKAKLEQEPERIIYTEFRFSHTAKNRYGMPYELPFPLDGAWDIIEQAIIGAAPSVAEEEPPKRTRKAA